jgi:hypothetical protein
MEMPIPRIVHHSDLTQGYGLVIEAKDKPVCSVTDLFHLLHYYWCRDESACYGRYRVQIALLIQLIAYTSSRSGSIIESNCFYIKASVKC